MTVGPFFLALCLASRLFLCRAISTKDRNESGVHAAPWPCYADTADVGRGGVCFHHTAEPAREDQRCTHGRCRAAILLAVLRYTFAFYIVFMNLLPGGLWCVGGGACIPGVAVSRLAVCDGRRGRCTYTLSRGRRWLEEYRAVRPQSHCKTDGEQSRVECGPL